MKQVSKLWTYKEKENSILSCGSETHFLFIFLKFCSPSSSWARTLNKAPNPEELRESVQGHLTFSTSISSLKNDNRTFEKCTLICCFIQSCKTELKCILDRKCLLLWYLYHPCDEIMSLILLHINTRMHQYTPAVQHRGMSSRSTREQTGLICLKASVCVGGSPVHVWVLLMMTMTPKPGKHL